MARPWGFVTLLGELVANYAVELHAFCLMENHYHLVGQFPDMNVSDAVAHLGQKYTQQFNHHHKVDGPLFRGRFGSVPIADDRQLLTVVRYVARNPLDLSPTRPLSEYRWSSHRSYLGLRRPPAWLTVAPVLKMLGGSSAYRSFVEDDVAESALERLVADVERLTGASSADLLQSRRGQTNVPRMLLAFAASELKVDTLEALAGPLGYSTAGALRSTVHRARQLRSTNVEFAERCSRLLEQFT